MVAETASMEFAVNLCILEGFIRLGGDCHVEYRIWTACVVHVRACVRWPFVSLVRTVLEC